VSAEWTQLLSTLGARCVLTAASDGMAGARARAAALAAEQPDALLVDQFSNPDNPAAHRHTTAEELLADFRDLSLSGLVVAVGTGGTLTGTAPALRRRWPDIQIWAVEPAASPVLSGGEPDQHAIPGIGADFFPPILDRDAYDAVIAIEDAHAWAAARALARAEGLLIDPAGGAAFIAARKLALKLGPDAHVAFICPSDGRQSLGTVP
jgi:cysteine synthase A